MELLILCYSSDCTPGGPRQTQIKEWSFPQLQCERLGTADSVHVNGFFALGNPHGGRNGDVHRGFWREGGRHPVRGQFSAPSAASHSSPALSDVHN